MIGAYAGVAAGAILLFLSHIAPRFAAQNFIQELGPSTIFGHTLSRREAHLMGILVHLILSLIYGALFAFGVERGWASFTILPILGWSVILLLFTGLIVMPLEGHGWFGLKHDAWFAVDALLTNLLWGVMYFVLIKLWLPM